MAVGRRLLSVVVVAALAAGLPTFAAAARAAGKRQVAATLYPGQTLRANTSDDSLSIGQFELDVESEDLSLWQIAVMQGKHYPDTWTTGIWFDGDRNGDPYTGHSVLRMQRDGNVVLRSTSHKILWQSRTHGRHNHFELRRSGALVVVTGGGRIVWSAHTHPVLLGDGSSLRPGGILNSRWGDWQGGPSSRLVMQRNGDAVLQCNGRTVWSTHTHRPGSVLSLLQSGNLVVRGPQGAVLWRSHSRSHTPYSVFNGPGLEITNDRLRTVWAGHQRRSACDPYA